MMRTIDTLNNQVQSAQLEQELFERYYCPLRTFCKYTLCAANKSSFHINCFFFLRRMSDLKSINEALRRALSLRLYNRVDDSGVLGRYDASCCRLFDFRFIVCRYNNYEESVVPCHKRIAENFIYLHSIFPN